MAIKKIWIIYISNIEMKNFHPISLNSNYNNPQRISVTFFFWNNFALFDLYFF